MNEMHYKNYKLSFPDSKKLLDESVKKYDAIKRLVYENFAYETVDQATKAVNELLYKTAKEKNISLYDLCFRTIPEYGTPEIEFKNENGLIKQDIVINQEVRLIPVEFDLTHDGGYWKGKYFALKAKIRELIENKDE